MDGHVFGARQQGNPSRTRVVSDKPAENCPFRPPERYNTLNSESITLPSRTRHTTELALSDE